MPHHPPRSGHRNIGLRCHAGPRTHRSQPGRQYGPDTNDKHRPRDSPSSTRQRPEVTQAGSPAHVDRGTAAEPDTEMDTATASPASRVAPERHAFPLHRLTPVPLPQHQRPQAHTQLPITRGTDRRPRHNQAPPHVVLGPLRQPTPTPKADHDLSPNPAGPRARHPGPSPGLHHPHRQRRPPGTHPHHRGRRPGRPPAGHRRRRGHRPDRPAPPRTGHRPRRRPGRCWRRRWPEHCRCRAHPPPTPTPPAPRPPERPGPAATGTPPATTCSWPATTHPAAATTATTPMTKSPDRSPPSTPVGRAGPARPARAWRRAAPWSTSTRTSTAGSSSTTASRRTCRARPVVLWPIPGPVAGNC
jgi:hypothetical protein